MAEQASHNVVNVPESASNSSPLADAVANHISTASAESGIDSSTIPSTEPTGAFKSQNTLVHDADAPKPKAVDAGEAAAEPSAGDAAAKPDNVPAIAQPVGTDGDIKADQGIPTINGVHDSASQGSAVEEGGSQDVSAANSDTDTSKGEALSTKDGHLHARTNSVKKPATFSKISFKAKSASTAPAAAKTGERASPVTTASAAVAPPAAKPRLIAKTGASLRELQKARQNAESPSGPDASKVWNKNRPTAPAPPKQFTDEELKQQYGIHLATRLQSDENGKESKWADIDEDEDDWVPEAVTWIDGTKSALTPADNTPVPKEAKPVQPEGSKPAEGVKPSLSALKKPTEPSGPPKTILKPGAAAAQAKQNGLPSQSPGTEKATLKAKSPAPPSKSPWATLPPVDKFSPVNIPVQQVAQHAPLATQDARAYEATMAPPQQPAREIAADTFDRSWREGEGGSRELFNSVTGQYETAPEGRRSSRPEPYGRKPSVLQRPSQQGMNHPPEPSPAFQTRSGSQTDGPPSWAHRRGSSVSQSGLPPRRMSINRGPEAFAAHERRTSTVAGHDMRTSPNVGKAEPPNGMFAQQNAWQQQMPPPPQADAGEELEDPVKVQERIMKEKRELARKRRQEEEQEAEAARKERLKAKMAALSGAGQSRQEREAAKEAAATAPKPAVEPDTIKSPLGREDKPATPKEPEAPAAASELAPEAQVPPPTSGTSDPVGTKTSPPEKIELPSSTTKPDGINLPSRSISDHLHRQVARGPLSPKANSRPPFQQAASPYHPPTSAFSSPGERKPQPFGRSPMAGNDGFSPWPSAGSGNVWGTGSIGNGVFESSSSFAPAPMFSQQNSALPPPPGMARPATSTRISPQGLGADSKSPSLQQNHLPEQGRAFAPPGMEGRPDQFMGQARPNGPASSPGLGRQQRVPGPIAPPSRAQPPMQSQPSEESKINAWRTAAQTLPAQYADTAQAAALTSEDAAPAQSNDTFRETFRQTRGGRLGGPRKTEKAEFTIHDAQGSRAVSSLNPAPPSTQTQPSVPVPTASPLSHPWKQTGENTVRLPNRSMSMAHAGAPAQQPPIGPPQMRHQPAPVGTPRKAKVPSDPLPPTVDSKEQPPPPPETATHPVFGGNAKHPHVRLPLAKPVVKLPPQSAASIAQQPAVVMPQRQQHWGPPAAMRPIVQNEAWQARFNGLFARTNITTETPPSPPKTPPKTQAPAEGVLASSRVAMPDASSTTTATVSLPQAQHAFKPKTSEGFVINDSDDVTSKDTIEQMFNEELSFGSKPLTRIPRNAVYPEAGFDTRYNMLNLQAQDLPRPVDSQSKAQFNIQQVQFRNSKGCFVKMPGVKTKHNPIFWKRVGQGKGASKPRAKAVAAKENTANSAPNAAPSGSNAGSRKASSQKVSTVSTPQHKSPAPTPPAAQAPANGKRGPNSKGPKGRGHNVPIKSA